MYRRSLWPREHGAYFQLGIPLATACIVGSPTMATICLAAGAMIAFLANEPLLVVLGHRGQTRRRLDGDRARTRLAVFSTGALGLGALGLALSPSAAIAAAIVGVPVLALLTYAWRRAEHTLAGEVVAAVALTGAVMPVLVASGASFQVAAEIWLGWALGFGASVLAVHRVIARHRRAASHVDYVHAIGMLAIVIAVASGWSALRIALPLVALSALLVIVPPPAKRLRAVGFAIVGAAIAAAAIVLAT